MTGSHPPAAARSSAASALLLACTLVLASCASVASWPHAPARTLTVTATAYNCVHWQTEGDPHEGAWGDRLAPGMRAIAVSPDLLALGFERGSSVRIAGLPGEWVVLDRMPSRWKRRIDVYMGKDVRAARDWGRREVQVAWTSP